MTGFGAGPPASPPPPPPPGHYPPSQYPPGAYPSYSGPAGPAPAYGGYGTPQWAPPAGPVPGLAYAGFWVRFIAYVIDAAILDLPLYGLLFGLFNSQVWVGECSNYSPVFGRGEFCSGTLTGYFWLGVLVITLLHGIYFTVLWSRSGRTVGQMALGLWVVDATNGARISFSKAITRFGGYIVNGLVLNLGYMWAGWDPQKQGWHDKIAGTFVVRRV
jgi:uncharacterized RDD family membrane protein YckC